MHLVSQIVESMEVWEFAIIDFESTVSFFNILYTLQYGVLNNLIHVFDLKLTL